MKKYVVGIYEIWEQMHEVVAENENEILDKIAEGKSKILENDFSFVDFEEANPVIYSVEEVVDAEEV